MIDNDYVGIDVLEREHEVASELQDKYQITIDDDDNLYAGNGRLIDDEELEDLVSAYLVGNGDDEAKRIIACLKQAVGSRVVE